MTDRLIAWGPAAVWAAVLFFLSAMPGLDRPPVLFEREDLAIHLLLYVLLGAALAWARSRSGAATSHAAFTAAGILYGASDEWHQSFVPGRDPSGWDFAADTMGVLLGYWITSMILARRPPIGGPVPLPSNQPRLPPE